MGGFGTADEGQVELKQTPLESTMASQDAHLTLVLLHAPLAKCLDKNHLETGIKSERRWNLLLRGESVPRKFRRMGEV